MTADILTTADTVIVVGDSDLAQRIVNGEVPVLNRDTGKIEGVPFWMSCLRCAYHQRNEQSPTDYIQDCPRCGGRKGLASAGYVPFTAEIAVRCSCPPEFGHYRGFGIVTVTRVHHAKEPECKRVTDRGTLVSGCHPGAKWNAWHWWITVDKEG